MKRIIPLLAFLCFAAGIAIIDSCKKDPVPPTLTTIDVTNITVNSATSGGVITKDGGAAVTARGVCWGTSASPTVSGSHSSDATGIGSFVSNLTDLTPNTVYYVRAYATNKAGTSYGNEVSFTSTPIVVPTLTTTVVSSITLTTAVTGGNVTADGNAPVTAKGVCWSTTTGPTVDGTKTSDGTGTGSFVSNLTGLQPGVTYYVRAYATNSAGTAYGNEVTFSTTSIVVPTLTTTAATLVTLTTAVTGGNITADGGGAVTARGVCWALTANPTVSGSKTSDATGIGSFISNLSGLTPGTIYHIRAYATNSAGTAYGNDLTFTTTAVSVPTLTTSAITSITLTSAVSGGNIVADGGNAVTARGICWASTSNPTISNTHTTDGTGTGAFTSNITGLTAGTIYYVRAYATNSAGTAYGNEVSFSSSQIILPTLTTTAITSITLTTAVSGGNVLSSGGGTVTGRGVCWGLTANPTITGSVTNDGSGTGSYPSNITGLTPGTTYHVRAYAVNSAGTAYGNDVTFTTNPIVVPTLTTATATTITLTSAVSGGNISADGGGTVTARGVCWSTTSGPIATGSHTVDASGTGVFTSNITGLTPGTLYYVRAYATNSAGTAYGNEISFTTVAIVIPTLTTTTPTAITQISATSGGNISADGGGSVTSRGVCWTTTANPTTANSKTVDGSGTGSFSSSITGLTAGTTYHVRSYAVNSAGTAYGNDISFTTSPVIVPTVTTTALSAVTATTATSGGTVTSDGGGAITGKGVCWSNSINPTIADPKTTDGTGATAYSSSITGLTPGTVYHVRAYATNSAGTSYGNDLLFTTLATAVPTVTTSAISLLDVTTVTSGGSITVAGAGAITAKGVCWSTSPNPTVSGSKTSDGTGTTTFTSGVTGLLPGTTYYLRAYATNNIGTGYGTPEIIFNTKVADQEGNKYNTVTLGSQVWMAENLKTTHYNNGDLIDTHAGDIWADTTAAYQWAYNDNASGEADIYGRLYNFYSATDSRGVCPAGFHLPSDAEWATLRTTVGDDGKSIASTTGWTIFATPGTVGNNEASNNSSGFNGVPAGFRHGDGTYRELNQSTYWRTSTRHSTIVTPSLGWYYYLQYQYGNIGRTDYANYNGFSVRCVK